MPLEGTGAGERPRLSKWRKMTAWLCSCVDKRPNKKPQTQQSTLLPKTRQKLSGRLCACFHCNWKQTNERKRKQNAEAVRDNDSTSMAVVQLDESSKRRAKGRRGALVPEAVMSTPRTQTAELMLEAIQATEVESGQSAQHKNERNAGPMLNIEEKDAAADVGGNGGDVDANGQSVEIRRFGLQTRAGSSCSSIEIEPEMYRRRIEDRDYCEDELNNNVCTGQCGAKHQARPIRDESKDNGPGSSSNDGNVIEVVAEISAPVSLASKLEKRPSADTGSSIGFSRTWTRSSYATTGTNVGSMSQLEGRTSRAATGLSSLSESGVIGVQSQSRPPSSIEACSVLQKRPRSVLDGRQTVHWMELDSCSSRRAESADSSVVYVEKAKAAQNLLEFENKFSLWYGPRRGSAPVIQRRPLEDIINNEPSWSGATLPRAVKPRSASAQVVTVAVKQANTEPKPLIKVKTPETQYSDEEDSWVQSSTVTDVKTNGSGHNHGVRRTTKAIVVCSEAAQRRKATRRNEQATLSTDRAAVRHAKVRSMKHVRIAEDQNGTQQAQDDEELQSQTRCDRCGRCIGYGSKPGSSLRCKRLCGTLSRLTRGRRGRNGGTGNGPQRRAKGEPRREDKATRTLLWITLIFIICWLPYYIVFTVEAFCSACMNAYKIWTMLTTIVLWLGWSNSALNPLIIFCLNKKLRQSMLKTSICQKPLSDSAERAAAIAAGRRV